MKSSINQIPTNFPIDNIVPIRRNTFALNNIKSKGKFIASLLHIIKSIICRPLHNETTNVCNYRLFHQNVGKYEAFTYTHSSSSGHKSKQHAVVGFVSHMIYGIISFHLLRSLLFTFSIELIYSRQYIYGFSFRLVIHWIAAHTHSYDLIHTIMFAVHMHTNTFGQARNDCEFVRYCDDLYTWKPFRSKVPFLYLFLISYGYVFSSSPLRPTIFSILCCLIEVKFKIIINRDQRKKECVCVCMMERNK